ncbi:MAG: hypothetical protein HY301_10650 [Verrucomicrobia bacterium]|nr:hypothetical protein [Verrucomicrobiota bacterium]
MLARLLLTLVAVVLFSTIAGAANKTKSKANQINTPDMWVVNPAPGSLPSGVTHHTYRSEAMKREVGYCLYLPPAYAKEPTRRFPVIYHLHGAGGNETRATYSAQVLDEGIRAGKWPDMIIVFPNGGRSTLYKDSGDGRFMAETTVIKELIPHIDATYRTIAARSGRCIEGFSMGGRGSTKLALKYPELFCSLFNQAGNVMHVSEQYDPANQTHYLGTDRANYLNNDPYLLLQKNFDQINGRLRIRIICGTADGEHIVTVREFHQALVKAGVPHQYGEVEGVAHDQRKVIDLNRTDWFDFHVESLRLAAAHR